MLRIRYLDLVFRIEVKNGVLFCVHGNALAQQQLSLQEPVRT